MCLWVIYIQMGRKSTIIATLSILNSFIPNSKRTVTYCQPTKWNNLPLYFPSFVGLSTEDAELILGLRQPMRDGVTL